MTNKQIDWIEVSKDNRSYIRIAKELGINEKTIYRNLKKRNIKKIPTKNSIETINRKKESAKKGSEHYNWKGDNVSYKRLHIWIKKHLPKPCHCEKCGINEPYDLANISGEYKRDVNDFEWLCRGCHMTNDKRINNLLKGNPNSKRDNLGKFIKGEEE